MEIKEAIEILCDIKSDKDIVLMADGVETTFVQIALIPYDNSLFAIVVDKKELEKEDSIVAHLEHQRIYQKRNK